MKSQFAGALVMALVAFAGGEQSMPGGPRATNPTAKNPVSGQADVYPHLKLNNPSRATDDPKGKDDHPADGKTDGENTLALPERIRRASR